MITEEPRTVICHFRNEEFFLNWWLPHHTRIFDHGVMIDYASTDQSRALCERFAPSWAYVPSRNHDFDAQSCDAEVMDIESEITGWKIALNATEFLWPPDLSSVIRLAGPDTMVIEARGAVMVDPLPLVGRDLDPRVPLVDQCQWGFFEDEAPPPWQGGALWRSRILHRAARGDYTPGRHGSHLPDERTRDVGLHVLWFGFSPWCRQTMNRRLAIQENIPEADRRAGRGFQHLVTEAKAHGMYASIFRNARNLQSELDLPPGPPPDRDIPFASSAEEACLSVPAAHQGVPSNGDTDYSLPEASPVPFRAQSDAGWLQLPPGNSGDAIVKPIPYLPIYERLLGPLREATFTLLEVGIWKGASLLMWQRAFPNATIIGVDLAVPEDFEAPERVTVIAGDQGDPETFHRIRRDIAPLGFDVVIDDASHFAAPTASMLETVFQDHLTPGGIYVIEDWGTGYWDEWPDGRKPSRPIDLSPSPGQDEGWAGHSAGMVGLVKRIIDHVGAMDVPQDIRGGPLPVESVEVSFGMAVLRKRSG